MKKSIKSFSIFPSWVSCCSTFRLIYNTSINQLSNKAYLEAHRPGLFNRLLLTGKLYEHLAEVDEQANEQLEQMIPKMALAEGVTEELKARDPIRWVGLMNNLKACAEESILSDLIYD